MPFSRDISEEHRKLSLEEETLWLRIRSLTLRLVSGLPTLAHTIQPKNSEKTAENGVSSKIDTIRALLQQLEAAVDSGKKFLEQKIQVPVKQKLSPVVDCECIVQAAECTELPLGLWSVTDWEMCQALGGMRKSCNTFIFFFASCLVSCPWPSSYPNGWLLQQWQLSVPD